MKLFQYSNPSSYFVLEVRYHLSGITKILEKLLQIVYSTLGNLFWRYLLMWGSRIYYLIIWYIWVCQWKWNKFKICWTVKFNRTQILVHNSVKKLSNIQQITSIYSVGKPNEINRWYNYKKANFKEMIVQANMAMTSHTAFTQVHILRTAEYLLMFVLVFK